MESRLDDPTSCPGVLMTYWQRLWRVEILGLASLFVFSVAVAAVFVLHDLFIAPTDFDLSDVAVLSFSASFAFGFLPVVLYGAPIYSTLIAPGKFHWIAMLIISVLPGIAFLFIHRGLGVFGIPGGAFIFMLVHSAYHRWVLRSRQ